MIQKEIKDYVPIVTKEINKHHQKHGRKIIFTEKEVTYILEYAMRNIFTTIQNRNDIHVRGFFKIFCSKKQLAHQNHLKNTIRYSDFKILIRS